MNMLYNIQEIGLKVTWKLIRLGLTGFNGHLELISYEELFDYLTDRLGINESQDDNIIKIICEKENRFSVDSLLNYLASVEKTTEDVQYRKLRVYLLEKLLRQENRTCLQGLLELIELWASFGYPGDCPHIFPDNVNISVQEYFTNTNYQIMRKKNSEWLGDEIKRIVQLEKEINGV